MSAKCIIVLALVAYLTVQASSHPYGTKGGQSYYGQSYSEPLKGQFAEPVVAQQAPQQVQASTVQVEAPVRGQSFNQVSAKGGEFYQQPAQHYETAPVKGPNYEAAPVRGQHYEAAPVRGQHYETAPVKGQSYSTQEPLKNQYAVPQRQENLMAQQHFETAPVQNFYNQEPLKGQYVPLQRRVESPVYKPVVQEAQVQASTFEAAPVKGQSYFQAPAKGGEFYQQEQHFDRAALAAPVKSTQSYSVQEPLKGQYVAPQRQEAFVAQQPQQLLGAPAQVETAPVKGQSFYQPEQRFESAPVRQVNSYKA